MEVDRPWLREVNEGGPGCLEIRWVLLERLRNTPEVERTVQQIAFADVVACFLDPQAPEPIRPRVPGFERPVRDLSQEELDLLEGSIESIAQPDVRARVLDVLWTRGPNRRRGEDAVRAYVAAAKHLTASSDSTGEFPVTRIRRAFVIARRMRWREGNDEVLDAYRELVRGESEWSYRGLQLARVAPDFATEMAEEVARLLITASRAWDGHEREAADWDWLREAFQTAALCFRAVKLSDEAQESMRARALSFVKHAEWLAKHGLPALMQEEILVQGIQAMRDAGVDRSVIDRAQQALREAQGASRGEMTTISVPFRRDLEATAAAVEHVTGRTFAESLHALSELSPPPTLDELRNAARQLAQGFVLQSAISQLRKDEDGRRVVRTPPVRADDDDDALIPAMQKRAVQAQQRAVMDEIVPAMHRIAQEHPVTLEQWIVVLETRALAEPRRLRSLAVGLSAGLQMDWLVSVPILVPQVEYMLRKVAASRRVTTKILADGTQDEVMLGTLLDRLEDFLGSEWVFDLKVLLTEKGGWNFRNDVAHGLLHDADVASAAAAYLWFSALRLLMHIDATTEATQVTTSDELQTSGETDANSQRPQNEGPAGGSTQAQR